MKTLKFVRLLTLVIACSMILPLFACNNEGGGVTETGQTTDATETTADTTESSSTDGETTEKTEESTSATVQGTDEVTESGDQTTQDKGEDMTTEQTTETKKEDGVYSPLDDPYNIISLNKDVEPFIIQGASTRSEFFKDKYKVLQFVHCSDMHAKRDNWDRMVEYVNYYDKYISFVLHTGDYVGGNQGEYVDFYKDGLKCDVEILNCVGNHDTMNPGTSQTQSSSQETVHKLLFGEQCKGWGVTFMEGDHATAYYKDFADYNIRLIVLDLYYDIDDQQAWLKGLLDDAKAKGYHVITAMHEPSDRIYEPLDTNFHSINDWQQTGSMEGKTQFEDIISNFTQNGGILIANLAGHTHHDLMGYTLGGVLNAVVESGTSWRGWCDANRVENTRTYDSFNVVSVDTNLGIIKIIRVGNNVDNFLREKKVFCYDYINQKVISGGSTSSSGSSGIEKDTYKPPEFVNKYLSYRYIASRPTGATYQITDAGIHKDGDVFYQRFTGKGATGQIFWTRIGGNAQGSWPSAQINPIDVGAAQYLIIKMRANNDISSLDLCVGTIVGDATYENRDKMKTVTVKLPQNVLNGEDWTVYVVDLGNTWKQGWVADENGNYQVCYLQYTFNSGGSTVFTEDTYFDFAYMAFVDDWTEVSGLVDSETVQMINSSNSAVEVNTKSGSCVSAHSVSEKVDGTEHICFCGICGTELSRQTVPASINKYISPAHITTLSHYNVASKDIVFEDGLQYVHVYSTSPNHMHLWTTGGGAGSAVDLGANTGNYLVMKFRTDMKTVSLVLGTGTSADTKDRKGTPTEQWETVVIDLASYTAYSRNQAAGTPVLMRINGYPAEAGGDYYIDIAYLAIVDSIAEATELITEETFDYYEDWMGSSVQYDTKTAQPK